MDDRILYVDDDPNILAASERSLGRRLKLTTATSGADGLEIIRKDGPFAVILSDMRMPAMDGVEFLCAARQLSPDSVCMMLTGNSDQETAMNAVNKGQIFRFLTKPCEQDVLADALKAGIKQYRLIIAEKELLQKTLTGSILALVDALGLVCPRAFARGGRIKQISSAMVTELEPEHPWQYEIAAMLSQIGCIVLPPETIDKVFSKSKLSSKEEEMYAAHPHTGSKLLQHIPRLEQSARMIEGQFSCFDEMENPDPATPAGAVSLGSQILRAAVDFDSFLADGLGRQIAIARMRDKKGEYNPQLIDILEQVAIPGIDVAQQGTVKQLTVWEIRAGMFANEDILASTGTLLVPKGNEITLPLIERLKNFANGAGVKEPIHILIPQEPASRAT